ncbi:two-component system, NtrC family, sensor histidine kinase HydH [Desulfatibacillum alkenivorans DSM 16219]|uniref:Sensor histidine kinase ZraS n=1 Tax=Desulfatibacillum alkenivorans DSM 16219 TaxID=1121393 RepID=A0A1M6VHK2_9BACT|nr:ATP-binding protein [Desulfatibacillum alkenivorans]SHK80940.1 two-component system, NtrC family, sensor histidine kinase HydH [Desulfatibacillum alkenivorans DSM 16219]
MLFRKKSRDMDEWAPMPPLVVASASLILLAAVVAMTVRDINRQRHHMSYILSEKGAAIIRAVEAGARTGLMGMRWGGNQVQTLLEEAAGHPDILYIGIVDKDGKILAHSNSSKIGQTVPNRFSRDALKTTTSGLWRIVGVEKKVKAFEVYRAFCPLPGQGKMRGRGMTMHVDPNTGQTRMDWCFSSKGDSSDQIIFVGLNMAPFENERSVDMRNTLLMAGLICLMGLGGFLALYWAQSYQVARRMLQDTSAFAKEVVTSLPVGLIAMDAAGRVAFFNHSAEIITGLSRMKTLGRDAKKIFSEHMEGLVYLLEPGISVTEQEIECEIKGKGVFPLSVSSSDILGEQGHYVSRIVILRDLREVRDLQEQVRRQEKLSAIGELAAGVAHEIRNPLSSIKGLATYFSQKFDKGSDDEEIAQGMAREVDRLNRVVSQLLDFARPSDLNLRPMDINELIPHSLKLVKQDALTKNINIISQPGGKPAFAMADADRLTQCLLNLYLNAMAAMNKGGVLTVRTAVEDSGDVRVEVEDTGKGIPSQDLNRIFDPYYTTKASGTGLGLAIVHKILEGHHARIKVESRPGQGTLVSMFIPGAKKAQDPKAQSGRE